jgi:hypothetical protein
VSSYRWSRAIGGWLAGCGAATVVLGVYILVVVGIASAGDGTTLVGGIIAAFFLVFPIICLLTAIPAAIVIWVSEKFRIRTMAFFGCAGAGIGGLSMELLRRGFGSSGPASVNLRFAIAGLAAGLVYWQIAGRYAGRGRQPHATST